MSGRIRLDELPEGYDRKMGAAKQIGLYIARMELGQNMNPRKDNGIAADRLIYQGKADETDWLFLFKMQESNSLIRQHEEFAELAKSLEAWLHPRLIGCCDYADGFDLLPRNCEKARTSLSYEIYFPERRIFFYTEMQVFEQKREAAYLYEIPEDTAMTNPEAVKAVLDRMVSGIMERKPQEEYVNKNFVNLYDEYRKKMSIHSDALEAIQYYDEIKKRRSVKEKQEYTLELITSDWKKNVILYTGGNVEISRALEYVHHHYSEELSLKQIADLAGLSENYFSSLFKQEMGENLITYINRVRIQYAKEMLRSGTMKVYEIAEKVGYRNTTYFSTMFKKITGMSVSEYKGR